MAFLVYERVFEGRAHVLRPTGENFSLAGYNLIYKAWEKLNKPVNKGWSVSEEDLIKLQCGNQHSCESRRLLVDFDPKSKSRIGIFELLNIYAYTHGNTHETVEWTPLMLQGRDAFYDEYDKDITMEKSKIIGNIPDPQEGTDFIEFLYLNGADKGWNWGRNGMTNAAFLQDKARDYFTLDNFFDS